MVFSAIDNQFVELRVLNYQYPKTVVPEDYDSNWLLIYLNVKSKIANWQTTGPCLLTWDIENIIDWLMRLSNNEADINNHLEFIEPNLTFELMESDINIKKIRIRFDLESKPQSEKEGIDYYVDCRLSNAALRQSASDLVNELKNYPKR